MKADAGFEAHLGQHLGVLQEVVQDAVGQAAEGLVQRGKDGEGPGTAMGHRAKYMGIPI